MKGKLIVFEGISGTGKETQAKLLKVFLDRKNTPAEIIHHPSPEMKMLLSQWRHDRRLDWKGEVYLLMADRYSRVTNMMNPLLEKGKWIISIRNYLSALVYQARNGKEEQWVADQFLHFEPQPDRIFLFDMEPSSALTRAQIRHEETGEPMGKFETLDILTQKRERYREVFKRVPHVVVDASKSKEDIHAFICESLHL